MSKTTKTTKTARTDTPWMWGVESAQTRQAMQDAITAHLVGELDNHTLGQVIGPDGLAYRICITATLEPVV
jgi:hypothetical protein